MLDRLGLVGRLVLIVLMVLVPLGLFGAGLAFYARSQETGTGPRLPLPDQAAAIAELLDRTPGERRDVVLRAVNSSGLRVTVVRERPAAGPAARSFPAVEWLLDSYLEQHKDRHVEVMMFPPPDSSLIGRLFTLASPFSTAHVRIAMALATGEHVLIETRGAPLQQLLGLPVGFWIGAFGTLMAGIAIAAIVRETKPIGELSEAVARFSLGAIPAPVASRGAPDVRGLIDAVNAMQERIAALLKGRTILLGAVSHDLKTYITRLRLRVEDIAEDDTRTRAVSDLDAMTALIDDAITVARNATVSGRRERVDIAALLSGEVSARDGARTVLVIGAGGHAIEGDPVGLSRLFANLIDNALRYGTVCEIACFASTGTVTVIVDDDGPGIPEAERAAVFEPFFRLEKSRSRETGGTGLGLTIVKQVSDAHGGHVAIEAAPLGGTRITVRLPRGGAGGGQPPNC